MWRVIIRIITILAIAIAVISISEPIGELRVQFHIEETPRLQPWLKSIGVSLSRASSGNSKILSSPACCYPQADKLHKVYQSVQKFLGFTE